MDFFKFYFLNTDFSLTIRYIHLKLLRYIQKISFEGSVSQNFDLGPGFIFMTWNIKNSEKILSQIFYII